MTTTNRKEMNPVALVNHQLLLSEDEYVLQCDDCGVKADDVVMCSDRVDRCEDCTAGWLGIRPATLDYAEPLEQARRIWAADPTELRWH